MTWRVAPARKDATSVELSLKPRPTRNPGTVVSRKTYRPNTKTCP
jgi:hypothetical protein